jgi:hypothetical protein
VDGKTMTEAQQQQIVDRLKRQRHELMLRIAKLDDRGTSLPRCHHRRLPKPPPQLPPKRPCRSPTTKSTETAPMAAIAKMIPVPKLTPIRRAGRYSTCLILSSNIRDADV